ncbi:MAG: collagen-like protein [Calothrix sp. FI2-JRJ7]|jgi:hypothetical protein|nr:collagen-like protein [Calothrix sp. FI2-JRJ7]
MYKLVWGKLALLLTVSLFSTSLPTSASDVCISKPYNIASRNYGTSGSDGSDGRPGRDGVSGQSQSIVANGSPINLDLSGKDGEDGEDGERGSSAYCSHQSNEDHDIQAASGGDGGDGGKGGDGGDGGLLTVYFNNLEELKQIFVRASAGEGGGGGRGASGAQGCNCRKKDWEIEKCKGTPGSPDYKCTKKKYRCTDGHDGSYGSNGSNGRKGDLGRLKIIKSKETLAPDIFKMTVPISELASKQFNLSKNKWDTKTGATALLAPGSVINDEYQEFDKRLEATFALQWLDKQPITRFTESATIILNDNNQVDITFPEDLWIDGNSKTEGNVTKYTLSYAVPKKDVTRLAVAEFAGAGENLNIKLVDLGGRSDIINTQFRIKYYVQDSSERGFPDNQKVYTGDITPELVTRDFNRFTLALGKLPNISEASRAGAKVNIELEITRTLGQRSAKQTINWQGTIRNR